MIKLDDYISNSGKYHIEVFENGELKEEDFFNNLITDLYLDELSKVVRGVTPDLQIMYVAIGTGTATPSASDTQLGTEVYRRQVTLQSKTGTGQVSTTFVIPAADAVFEWQEIGIYAGSSATATLNSGTLISRVLYNRNKTILEEININRVDTNGR